MCGWLAFYFPVLCHAYVILELIDIEKIIYYNHFDQITLYCDNTVKIMGNHSYFHKVFPQIYIFIISYVYIFTK